MHVEIKFDYIKLKTIKKHWRLRNQCTTWTLNQMTHKLVTTNDKTREGARHEPQQKHMVTSNGSSYHVSLNWKVEQRGWSKV